MSNKLAVSGVQMFLGNDLAGKKVVPETGESLLVNIIFALR